MQNGSFRFCCCSSDFCNTHLTEAPPTAPPLRLVSQWDDRQTDQPLQRKETLLVTLVTVAIAAILIMALFLGYRMMKEKQKHSLSAVDVMEAHREPAVDLDHLKLLELIGDGRYGNVFRGCLGERCVAVKVFGSAHRQNYVTERSAYFLLQHHDHIARFLSATERTASDGRPEFLILMEYYPHGCLSRYLSLHTVDWSTCCRMTHGVTRGLAFLHTELYRADQYKPAVAHRDVTSSNVLVRADLSCVLSDFGLSMRLTGSTPCCPGNDDTMAISEVGTVRYMAPEVLGGALNLRDCESALKQVDIYALGLLYWESFRRCSDLFPGEAVPEYQLAFQAELGNHPSLEEMQMLVCREKYRPRFPEAWKENSLVLRSLKETMEDCWDQDAEARLTAQCAEERLSDLTLLSTHTLHNHRSLGCRPPQVSSASSILENLPGDGYLATVLNTTSSQSQKNTKSINYKRQQSQAHSASSDSTVAMTTVNILCSVSESEHTGGAVASVPVCLQLTEDDLETTKLNPKEVDKNLREISEENLMECSQKQFGSREQPTSNLLFNQILQTTEVNSAVVPPHGERGGVGGVNTTPSSFIHPLPKQQNLPQRPTNLQLLSQTKETTSASSNLKLGKLKSNHRQVETGVAKMNAVTVAMAAEPHLVTMVSNNTCTKGNDTSGNRAHLTAVVISARVSTLVTNGMIDGGRTNPGGPQVEEEDKTEGGMSGGEDSRLNLLNSSPDEHEPLLRREQPPAESEDLPRLHHQQQQQPQAGNVLSGRGSNSNNNNNRLVLGKEVKIQDKEVKPEKISSSQVVQDRGTTLSQQISASPDTAPVSSLDNKIFLTGSSGPASPGRAPTLKTLTALGNSQGPDIHLCVQTAPAAEPVLFPGYAQNPNDHLLSSAATAQVLGCKDPDSGPGLPSAETVEDPRSLASQAQDPETTSSKVLNTLTLDSRALIPETLDAKASDPESLALEATDMNPTTLPQMVSVSELEALESQCLETPVLAVPGLNTSAPEPAALQGLQTQTQGLLQPQMAEAQARTSERPCSLDLSSSCIPSVDVSLTDNSSLSTSGEKIKRRVKTPYTLKKWRPASWAISTETAVDPDFEFSISSSNSHHITSGPHGAGRIGISKIKHSKSSMAVFLIGSGTTATTTSEPDGMTCF
ncbi:LOW QUALITY PROTEIN: bone morphogenetic protein receptor type-2-like [Scomber scombrus]|uniref:receptor protein serine/threonine kinase n=1 Tax=Scomber scombrus TaxID=13677 RepID=A0AAV1QI41_SCOSC